MKLKSAQTLAEIAGFLGRDFSGPADFSITGINELHKVGPGDVSFVDHPNWYGRALGSAVSVLIINTKPEDNQGKHLIFSETPFEDYNKLALHYCPFPPPSQNFADDLVVGENTWIGPGCVIGEEVVIGRNCRIHPNVTIYNRAVIGDNVEIHAGTVIGGHAFYFKTRTLDGGRKQYDKMHSIGRVVIGNDVEIGASCTIDKGVSGDTIIGAGSKLDNMVHVGHGAVIGTNCLFAAQVGIGGKAIIGNNVVMWGQVGVSKDLTIGDNAVIYAQSGVKDSIEGNKVYFGSPVNDARTKMKELALLKRLPEIWDKVRGLK